jgi:acyl phosphate:glycerol-3-phosphate acyltransferase
MTTPLLAGLGCLGGFLLGSIPFGVLAGKLHGIDLQKEGSGNIGATNAMRLLGKRDGALVLLLDTLKSFLPVFLCQRLGLSAIGVVGVGLSAVVGHIYSPWVRFKGGKGVATSLGVLFGLSPLIAALTLVVFALALFLSGKRVSVGSMTAAVAATAMFWTFPGVPVPYAVFTTIAAVFIVVRHRENIKRLVRREEKPLF